MKPALGTSPIEIVTALLGGSSAAQLSECIGSLSADDRRELCCTLCSMRDEVAANCRERAEEIDRFLAGNGSGSPPVRCTICVQAHAGAA